MEKFTFIDEDIEELPPDQLPEINTEPVKEKFSVIEEDNFTGIKGAPEYTSEQAKIVRDMLQLAAGREEANLFTNPVTSIPAIGNEILNLFGEGLPEAPSKVVNTLGNLAGFDLDTKDEREKSARLAGVLTSMSPGEIVQLVKEVPALGKYIVQLPQKIYKAIVNKSPELLSEANKIAEKFGLRKFRGLEEEAAPVNAVVSKSKQAALKEEVDKGSQEAIDRILDSKLPARTARKEGIDLKTAYEDEYALAGKELSKSKSEIDTSDFLEFIDNKIKEIQSSAPALSDVDKRQIRILNKFKKEFTEPAAKTKSNLILPEHLTPPSNKGRTPKKVSRDQFMDQYQNFNEDVSNIYNKTEHTGYEEATKDIYEEIKKAWVDNLRKTDPEAASKFESANKLFHEKSKLDRVENILSKAFSEGYNPGKLDKILDSNRNGKFLERYLGKESIKDLKEIAKYGKEAEKKIFGQLKNPQTALEVIGHLSPLKLALILGKHGKTAGLYTVGSLAKGAINRIQGAMFTSPTVSSAYSRFIKAASGGNLGEFQKASAQLSAVIKEEFGSEKTLEKYAKEQ